MSTALPHLDGELPSTLGVRVPRTRLLSSGRLVDQRLLRAVYDVELHGTAKVPAGGGVVMAADHVDLVAVRTAVASLRAGQSVGVFPEGTRGAGDMASPRSGAACLALVTGAPAVPVAFPGTRPPGSDQLLPPRATRVAMTFGDPVHLARRTRPRTQTHVDEAAHAVTAAILQTSRPAEQLTGMTLPGPLGPKREKKS